MMIEEKMIKEQASFVQNLLFLLDKQQQLHMPPTLENIHEAYSCGVLAGLIAVKKLMVGKPVNGLCTSMVERKTLDELLEQLGLSSEWGEFDE